MSKKKVDVKVVDLGAKVREVSEGKLLSNQVVEIYKELLKDAPKEYNPIIHPSVATIVEENKDELEVAKLVAIQLKKIIVNVMFKDDTWAGKGYFNEALNFIKDAAELNNEYLKRNLLSTGEGWYEAILPFTIDYTDEVRLSKTAALATIAANLDLVSFEDGVNWMLPNFDLQLSKENRYLYDSLANTFMVNDAKAENREIKILKEKKEKKDPTSSINEALDACFGVLDEVEKKNKSEDTAKQEEKSRDFWKIAGMVGFGAATLAAAGFIGWKVGEYISSTEVISSNKD